MVFQKNNTAFLGRKHSEETKRRMREVAKGRRPWNTGRKAPQLAKNGENNPMWKGDDVGNNSLHEWVRNHLLRPQLCQMCNKTPPFDLANITGKYNRDYNNWQYLCRRCHMRFDFQNGVRKL